MIGTATDLTRATAGVFLDPYLEYRKGRASATHSQSNSRTPSRASSPTKSTYSRNHSPTKPTFSGKEKGMDLKYSSTNPTLSKSSSFNYAGEGPSRATSAPLSPTLSTTSASSTATKNHGIQTAGKMAAASAKSVGAFNSSLFRGMMVDLPLAVAEGMRNVPSLYGDDVKTLQPVTDWKSGAVVAGKNFAQGLAGGVSDV